jgi:hypothetical protein
MMLHLKSAGGGVRAEKKAGVRATDGKHFPYRGQQPGGVSRLAGAGLQAF